MPFNIGPGELIIVLIIALIVVGPGKLPDVGAALGKSIKEFRKAATDVKDATSLDDPAPAAVSASTAPRRDARPERDHGRGRAEHDRGRAGQHDRRRARRGRTRGVRARARRGRTGGRGARREGRDVGRAGRAHGLGRIAARSSHG